MRTSNMDKSVYTESPRKMMRKCGTGWVYCDGMCKFCGIVKNSTYTSNKTNFSATRSYTTTSISMNSFKIVTKQEG